MRTTADIAKEVVMRWKNDLYSVVDFQHVNPGKGSAPPSRLTSLAGTPSSRA